MSERANDVEHDEGVVARASKLVFVERARETYPKRPFALLPCKLLFIQLPDKVLLESTVNHSVGDMLRFAETDRNVETSSAPLAPAAERLSSTRAAAARCARRCTAQKLLYSHESLRFSV